jgi:eukaryotic-like serine/threonine-protein kinase
VGGKIIGSTLLDQYRVDEFIASGGSGAVYRAWDLRRNVAVAVKVLHAEVAEDPVLFKSFEREARALRRLTHPNVVPFYGLYQTDEFIFLIERFVDGGSLQDVLKKRQGKPMEIGEALVYLKGVSAALGYAHAMGVVHCDVKPGNVMLDEVGSVYLTDFGIARYTESTTTTLAGAGTPAYMAPEQIRAEMVSPATDVYALAVMAFEMLAGQRPFRGLQGGSESAGPTANERIRHEQLHANPPDSRTLNPTLPPGAAAALLKGLNKDVHERYRSVQDFVGEIALAAGIPWDRIPNHAQVPRAPESSARVTPSPTQNWGAAGPAWNGAAAGGAAQTGTALTPQRKNKTGALFVAGAGLIAVILLVVAFMSGRGVPSIHENGATGQPTSPAVIQTMGQATAIIASPTALLPTLPPTLLPTHPPTIAPTLPPTSPPPTVVSFYPPACTAVGQSWVSPLDGMTLVCVPGGSFLMGSNATDANANEKPQRSVSLKAYWIDRTEVTNKMFTAFVAATHYQTSYEQSGAGWVFNLSPEKWVAIDGASWKNPMGSSTNLSGLDEHPVVQVTWQDAQAYCQWARRRLPDEQEWEKAARGTQGNEFPWGNAAVAPDYLNLADASLGRKTGVSFNDGYKFTAPVGSYPKGKSPYGALDMAGNVTEWVDTVGANSSERIMRGGCFVDIPWSTRTSRRFGAELGNYAVGFRCVK